MPGWFRVSGTGLVEVVLRARAEFPWNPPEADRPAVVLAADPPSPPPIDVEDRLRQAANSFGVQRRRAIGGYSTTILAGYHWFGDWGRDTFIALPGLLLETRRFAEAREVFETFASAQQDGLIPNRFSDYGDGCDYNSVDASLWYIHAADAYCRMSNDAVAWDRLLGPVCERVVKAFLAGTRFNIRVDTDGLVSCGDATTQLTWMDAKYGATVFTPRHGKPVEINALCYHILNVLAERQASADPVRAHEYRVLAAQVRKSFVRAFWNSTSRCLYDVVRNGRGDPAIRPNQILAVSLPHSPLAREQQRMVLECIDQDLYTPYGLRSLSPLDPAYKGRCEGTPFERDSAYHQGTVWAWLIGPYVEAHLRVAEFSGEARKQMRSRLTALIKHLDDACIGSVSEIFDGDPPHKPRGCIAQAWSVAELLRAWRMTAQ